MKRVFETEECEEVRNSIFWVQRNEKHENQMKGCVVELKVSDWQINAWALWACGEVEQLPYVCYICNAVKHCPRHIV